MSELTKRVISGSILAALLLGDLWLGSWWYLVLLLVGAALVLREFVRLVWAITSEPAVRALWVGFGIIYVALAINGLWQVRALPGNGLLMAAWLFLVVWATDTGAYIVGRTIGGPKIAPAISPSKTWAGFLGGCIFAALVMVGMSSLNLGALDGHWLKMALLAVPLVILAQAGDFFESWMKRRAGVKDSGTLIPGHGGLFDRVDGLLPVAIVFPWLMGVR